MFDELSDLYQEVILDHSRSPRNFQKLEVANRVAEGHNPVRGPRHLYVLLEDDVIRDISFQGSGCAISKASASMMTASLKGKSKRKQKSCSPSFMKWSPPENPTPPNWASCRSLAGQQVSGSGEMRRLALARPGGDSEWEGKHCFNRMKCP